MKRTPHVNKSFGAFEAGKVNSSIRHKVCNSRENLWLNNNPSTPSTPP